MQYLYLFTFTGLNIGFITTIHFLVNRSYCSASVITRAQRHRQTDRQTDMMQWRIQD